MKNKKIDKILRVSAVFLCGASFVILLIWLIVFNIKNVSEIPIFIFILSGTGIMLNFINFLND